MSLSTKATTRAPPPLVPCADEERRQLNYHLLQAAKRDDVTAVRDLLQCGIVDINTRDVDEFSDSSTPLFYACLHGDSEMAALLVEAGADANAANQNGATALHRAAERGHAECMKILLMSGSSAQFVDYEEQSPLHYACINWQPDAIRVLLEFGADLEVYNRNGYTPFACALLGPDQRDYTDKAIESMRLMTLYGAKWDDRCDAIIQTKIDGYARTLRHAPSAEVKN